MCMVLRLTGATVLSVLALAAPASAAERVVTLTFDGDACTDCAEDLSERLTALRGVRVIRIELEADEVSIAYDDAETSPEALANLLLAAGYSVDRWPSIAEAVPVPRRRPSST